jgi:multiple sugar transport system substrate-binding protein
MDSFKKRMIIMGGVLIVTVLGILIFNIIQKQKNGTSSGCTNQPAKAVSLTWWGALPVEVAQPVIDSYRATHPYVNITYTQLDPKTSDSQLIEAWAKGTGPDIYSVRNDTLRYYMASGFINPMPAKTTSYTYTKKKVLGIKEELSVCKQVKNAPTAAVLQKTYVAGAVEDMYRNSQILAFPLEFDSVAMFYNQKILDDAGILTPPETWTDFVEKVIPKITLTDDKGKIVRAGAAIGRGTNVVRNPEILAGILREYNIELTDAAGAQVTFEGGKNLEAVLGLASSFGNPLKRTYTWDETFPESFDALIQGKAAIAFGTLGDYNQLAQQATGSDIRVAPFPQAATGGTNFVSSYWLDTVATRAVDANTAWDFLRFAADTPQAKKLSDSGKVIPAVRSLVETIIGTDETTQTTSQVFASQASTARGWYFGLNATWGREALNTLIDSLATQKETTSEAIDRAASLFRLSLTKAGR